MSERRDRPEGAVDTITHRLSGTRPTVSFEFMPPKDDAGEAALWTALEQLEAVGPDFVSVTYGAGGSSQDRTMRITEEIARRTSLTAMAHLTCVAQSVEDLREVLRGYAAAGIVHVLALRGDPPGDPRGRWTAHPGGLDHADQLVALVHEVGMEVGPFEVGVAAFPDVHPDSASLEDDVETLVRKADAGATFAVTQMIFDPETYLRLRDSLAERRDMPVTPGIMPITSIGQITRMSQLMGTPLPDAVLDRLRAVDGDPQAVREVGMDIATEHAARLLGEGAPGLHFITMNRSTATVELRRRLDAWWS